MNASPVPTPVSARVASVSAISGVTSAIALEHAITARPARPTRLGPKRSLAFPPGICNARWVRKSAVVNKPTVASPTPYASASGCATAPVLAVFHPVARPSAHPPTTARRTWLANDPDQGAARHDQRARGEEA